MIGVKDKIWFLREGLFAKYVISLVGLVVFVLAVNGATGNLDQLPRHQDHADRRHGREGGGDRAADRAIDLRAGAADQLGDPRQRHEAGTPPRRLCPAAEPGAVDQPALAARRQRPRAAAAVAQLRDLGRQRRRIFRATSRFTDTRGQRRQLRAGLFPGTAGPSCRSRWRIPASTPTSPSPRSICASCWISSAMPQVGKVAFAYVVDNRGQVLASSAKGPEVGQGRLATLPQVAALIKPDSQGAGLGHRRRRPCGADRVERGAKARLARAVRAADRAGAGADPRPAWCGSRC